MKGKDMILSDFLLQQKNDDSNPNKIIPISFDMYQVLENNFYLENFAEININSKMITSQIQWY